ncbi:hypothetical protein MTR67_037415 [Solanum verrucosum]|uniref:Uncharacterized protein n=1 Tax=Solanum verrucosum TaxID=315347 RepID=A0AAF0ZNL5_SOLVR|nr:hypothetical protein MTR67_037415 [Solanum verrucosum]
MLRVSTGPRDQHTPSSSLYSSHRHMEYVHLSFDQKWVMPSSIKDALVCWSSWKVGKPIREVWKMIPSCIFWCVWTEKNNGCFEGISSQATFLSLEL